MLVTATDLKTNLGKYLDLLDTDDIIVTRNGRRIARIIREEEDVLAEVQSLYGILSTANDGDTATGHSIQEERMTRHDSPNRQQRTT